MIAQTRILLAGLPLVLVVLLADPADAVTLTLRIVDAQAGTPSAARIQILDINGPVFAEENVELRTHVDAAGHPYFYAEDLRAIELPPANYLVRSYAGPTSIPREIVVPLTGELEQDVEVEHWINPRDWGWYCADPHTHLDHADDPSAPPGYLTSTTSDAGRNARAEGLDVLYLLENDPVNPFGLVVPNEAGVSVCWGEEFRSGFWGHLVVLPAADLVTVAGNPWANGPGLPAWPMLRKVLQDNVPLLAYMAHPMTGDDRPYNSGWPSVGFARELPALVDVPELHGIAVGSGSNGPSSAWEIAPLREGLSGGAQWAAFGETDAVMDRFSMRPLGSPRTYAFLTKSPAPGSAAMEQQWRSAARDGHSYATDGPLLLEFSVGGASMGETAFPPDEFAALELHLISWTPLQRVTLWGSSGRAVDIPIDAQSLHELQLTLDVEFETDELVFLEAVAQGGTWYAQEDSLRLVSSPVRVVRGVAPTTPEEWARRHADGLDQLWRDSILFRGYESEDDSTAACGVLEDAEANWESRFDDAPGEFSLAWPWDGREVGSQGLQLSWSESRGYDGEGIHYELHLDDAPDFADAEQFPAIPDTFLFLQNPLEPGQYWWRVRAYEPDGDSTWMAESAPSFTVVTDPVGAPAPQGTLLRLSAPHPVAGGVRAFLELSRETSVRWTWYDARGRLLYRSPRESLPSGRHALRWDGRDQQGRGVASGVYWLVADAEGRRDVRSAVLLEP